MAFDNPPWCMDNTDLDAEVIRRAIGSLLTGGGVVTPGDLTLSQNGTPNMSVNVGPGQIWVPGTSTPTEGPYYSQNKAALNLSISASNPSLPRIDTIIAGISDAEYTGAARQFAATVLAGTATAGATLTNQSGAAAPPASSVVIGYVLVPANATSITNADLSTVVSVAKLSSSLLSAALGGRALVAPTGSSSYEIPYGDNLTGRWNYRSGDGGEVALNDGDVFIVYGAGMALDLPPVASSPGAEIVVITNGPVVGINTTDGSNVALPGNRAGSGGLVLNQNGSTYQVVRLLCINNWAVAGGFGPGATGVDRGTATDTTNSSGYVQFTVAHNLGVVPQSVELTPLAFTGFVQVENKTATTFDITVAVVNSDATPNPGGSVTWGCVIDRLNRLDRVRMSPLTLHRAPSDR